MRYYIAGGICFLLAMCLANLSFVPGTLIKPEVTMVARYIGSAVGVLALVSSGFGLWLMGSKV